MIHDSIENLGALKHNVDHVSRGVSTPESKVAPCTVPISALAPDVPSCKWKVTLKVFYVPSLVETDFILKGDVIFSRKTCASIPTKDSRNTVLCFKISHAAM